MFVTFFGKQSTISNLNILISSLIPMVYKRITDSANIANPYIIVAAVIFGILSVCIVYFRLAVARILDQIAVNQKGKGLN
jgi:cytochrome c biogenesis factor